MIAGEGLMGILLAVLAIVGLDKIIDISGMLGLPEWISSVLGLVTFILIIVSLLVFSLFKKRNRNK